MPHSAISKKIITALQLKPSGKHQVVAFTARKLQRSIQFQIGLIFPQSQAIHASLVRLSHHVFE